MKKMIAGLLLASSILVLPGCAREPAPPETTQAQTTAPSETMAETETPAVEGSLFLKVSSITFSLVGEQEDIYLGLVPRELVTWESEDPSVVSVENGVLTAKGVGTTTIRATYSDRQVVCTAGCLAETREALDGLDPQVLSAPKRLPPQVDLEAPCTYFDNAAIFGDSITYFLWQSESQNNYLGDLQFVTRQGVSILGLVRRNKNLHFRGQEMYVEDIAAQCGAQRIYLALGCLDFQYEAGRDSLMDSWNTMLDRITEKCPDVELVILSNIPCYTERTTSPELNDFISASNIRLRALAAERGCGFLDLGYYIQDHYGRMSAIYSKDDFHMNDEGSLAWMRIMRFYAQYEQEGGTLS